MKDVNNKGLDPSKINPNYQVIGGYYKSLNKERFIKNLSSYSKKGNLKELYSAIKKFNLTKWTSDIIYFWIEASETIEFNNWAKNVKLSTVQANEIKNGIVLLDFLSKIRTNAKYLSPTSDDLEKLPVIKEIILVPNKGKQIKINSYPLCFDLINLVENYVNSRSPYFNKKSNLNINPRHYNTKTILYFKPFIAYLNKETKTWHSQNKIYEFLCDFILTIDVNYDISSQKIEDVLKKHQ